jgi:hypothetical protein
MKDWTTVVPAAGAVKETAQTLLSLAEHPNDVRTVRGGMEFLVAPYVAERYTAPEQPRRTRRKKEVEPDGD